jgi:hypothetical protein
MAFRKRNTAFVLAFAIVACGCSSTPPATQDPVMSKPEPKPLSKSELGMLDEIQKLPEGQRKLYIRNHGKDIASFARTNSNFRDRLRELLPATKTP